MAQARWRVGTVFLFGCAGAVWISSCSDPSSKSAEDPEPASAVGTARSELIDGCTAQQRTQCGAFGCGCLNGSCSGGACPVTAVDGCTDLSQNQCEAFGCGCLNGNCSGGACPALADGCTTQRRSQCAAFGCGCLNDNCSGDACPALVDGCTAGNRSSCSAAGCGCLDDLCSGNACVTQADGCTDQTRANCAVFGCGCSGNVCFGGNCTNPNDSVALPIPPVLRPTSTNATTDFYSITVKTGTAQIRPGARTPIVGFNGLYPGPTIIATKGRLVKVTQTNGWTENISIHNHGHKVQPASDGHPTDFVTPGQPKVYTYPNDQRGGTYWYHDHVMDRTGDHVNRGLAAFYIIRDPSEDDFNLPSGKYDVPLMIQDKSLSGDNTLGAPGFGSLAVVNGALTPHFDVDTHRYRFRILNAANERAFSLKLSSGRSFKVIGSDGGLLAAPVTLTQLNVAPAERYDVVIDFTQTAVGTNEFLTDVAMGNLVEFRVKTAVADTSSVPAGFNAIAPLPPAAAAFEVHFGINSTGQWTINGKTYDPARIDVTTTLGVTNEWKIFNDAGPMHPFHKHLAQFRILDIGGVPPAAEQLGWKDTVPVEFNKPVRIAFMNEGFTPSLALPNPTGIFVFHCHNLTHEDRSMMAQEKVQ